MTWYAICCILGSTGSGTWIPYLDYLILDALENDQIGYIAIAQTLLVLYVAGSDTLANTMQWFCLNMTAFPEIQGQGLLHTLSQFVKFQQL